MPKSRSTSLGLVSNCWKTQLDDGTSLIDLIHEAVRRDFRFVELRQGCLGEFEVALYGSAESGSALDALAQLPHQFPDVAFNLAVSIPCFSGSFSDDDPRFLNAVNAATALARDGHPHLRLVDTETRTPELNDSAIADVANVIARMTMKLVSLSGWLSVEHAYQSWRVYWFAFQQARNLLGANADRLQCCFDPCNLLLTEDSESVPAIVDTITPADVTMIHLKQRRNGQIQPDVSEGDLNWPQLLESLQRRGHTGPWLFEVAPHEDTWNNLQQSVEYLFA